MYNLKNVCTLNMYELSASRDITSDLPDSTVEKNPPANPGDMDSITGSRRKGKKLSCHPTLILCQNSN